MGDYSLEAAAEILVKVRPQLEPITGQVFSKGAQIEIDGWRIRKSSQYTRVERCFYKTSNESPAAFTYRALCEFYAVYEQVVLSEKMNDLDQRMGQ